MTRRVRGLAWAAAACTYFLIVLGRLVRIRGWGLGGGEHWPRFFGRWFPPLNDIGTLIEWNHRLFAGLVTVLVAALAAVAWWDGRSTGTANPDPAPSLRSGPLAALGGTSASLPLSLVAVGLLALQITLGAIVVKLALPPWTVILHLGTAMLLLATLLVMATGGAPLRVTPGFRPEFVIPALGFVTVLFGALTANLGAASACLGFPLCNGQVIPAGTYLRSEEHTSELQSRSDLVCRLLLEKKKKTAFMNSTA